MTMPGDITFDSGDSYFGGNLTKFVQDGQIKEDVVTVRRLPIFSPS